MSGGWNTIESDAVSSSTYTRGTPHSSINRLTLPIQGRLYLSCRKPGRQGHPVGGAHLSGRGLFEAAKVANFLGELFSHGSKLSR